MQLDASIIKYFGTRFASKQYLIFSTCPCGISEVNLVLYELPGIITFSYFDNQSDNKTINDGVV
jgi:hypothetical protein